MHLDVPAALLTIQAALPRLAPLRADMAKVLPSFDATQLDWLSDAAEKLAAVVPDPSSVREPQGPGFEDYAEAVAFRGALLDAVQLLASLEHVDTRTLGTDGLATRPSIVAHDLITLCRSILEAPPRLRRRCRFSPAQLRRGLALGTRILTRNAERNRARARSLAAASERHRAFKTVYFAYHDVRAAVHALRRHAGDADALAPDLGRGPFGPGAAMPVDEGMHAAVLVPACDAVVLKRAS